MNTFLLILGIIGVLIFGPFMALFYVIKYVVINPIKIITMILIFPFALSLGLLGYEMDFTDLW